MIRWLLCAAALLNLTACSTVMTPPVVQVPLGQMALLYADGHSLYTLVELRATEFCKAGKIKPEDCAALAEQGKYAAKVDAEIRQSILSAKGEIDWTKVMELVGIMVGMAKKFAL
jgi:uncharacterized lipoprotein YmbA